MARNGGEFLAGKGVVQGFTGRGIRGEVADIPKNRVFCANYVKIT